MTIQEIQAELLRLKQEKDFCILAHCYQGQEILEIADYTGDSYGLSVRAREDSHQNVVMCGVRFMAETCKVLCPEKRVYLPNPTAGCPMAEQMDLALVEEERKKHPGCAVVAYINTTSALKTACDVCVTSSSAVKICKALDAKEILFLPDQNLARYVAGQVPEKRIHFLQGGCPYHSAVTLTDVSAARAAHPDAALLVHPECPAEVVALADYVGSTTGIMDYAARSASSCFLIGTETSIVEHLQFSLPDKRFYALSNCLVCQSMRATTLLDVYRCVQGLDGEEITLPQPVLRGARRCIDEMIRLGG